MRESGDAEHGAQFTDEFLGVGYPLCVDALYEFLCRGDAVAGAKSGIA